MAFVLGAAFEVVDGIGGLCQGLRRIAELPLNLRLGAREKAVCLGGLSRNRADAADDSGGFLDILAVNFEDQVNPCGVQQARCTLCGDCTSGCNDGAKNTMLMNYLPDAHTHGADIFTQARVSHVEREGDGWRVHFLGPPARPAEAAAAEPVKEQAMSVKARIVVLGADGYRPGEKKAWVWGALKDFPSWKLKDRMVRAYLKRNRFLNAHSLSFSNMKRFADAMLEWKPDMFRAYPTAITIFAKFLSDNGYSRIKPKLIETSGEKLSIAQRLFLNEIFEAPIAEHYSSWEIYDIGYQCPNGSLHISEHRYLEVVDDQGKPAKPGEIGEIVITPLTQFAMPFIRYKNGDLGVLGSHRCPCGRGLPVLSEVVVRKHDILIRPDGQPVYGSVFGYITHNRPEIKQFQVYQADSENLEVRLSCYCPVPSR